MCGMLSMVEVSLEVKLKAKNVFKVVELLLILLTPRIAWSPSGGEGREHRSLWFCCLLCGD